jgi:hypothetical protein
MFPLDNLNGPDRGHGDPQGHRSIQRLHGSSPIGFYDMRVCVCVYVRAAISRCLIPGHFVQCINHRALQRINGSKYSDLEVTRKTLGPRSHSPSFKVSETRRRSGRQRGGVGEGGEKTFQGNEILP